MDPLLTKEDKTIQDGENISEGAVEQVEVLAEDSDDFDYGVLDNAIEASVAEETPEPQVPVVEAPVVQTPVQTPAEGPAVVTPVPAAAAPASAPVDPAAVAAPQAAPAVETPQQAASQAQAPTPQAENVDGFTALDQAIEKSREKVVDAVAQGSYQLSQEELEQISTEPEKVVPRLLARVHVNAVQGVLRHVASQMPMMVGALLQTQVENTKREETFFSRWPQLDRSKHRDDIVRVGQVYKQLNPNATVEDFIKHVGAQVVMLHGLHAQQAAASVQPVAPATPAYRPAGAGRTSAPAVQTQDNPWAEFVEVMNDE